MRLFLGVAAGVVLGAFLPLAGGDTERLVAEIAVVLQNASVFVLLPLVFFVVMIAVDELREDGRLWLIVSRTAALSLAIALVAALLGVVVVLGLEPQRIPPILQEAPPAEGPMFFSSLAAAIGRNFFRTLARGPHVLASVILAALVVGAVLRFDREITEPVRLVADSINRILYRINAVVVDWIFVPAGVTAALVTLQSRAAGDLLLFGQLVLVVGTTAGVAGVVILPLLLRFLRVDHSPLRWLYVMLSPALVALATGDAYMSLSVMNRIGKENLGVSRRAGGWVFPVSAAFLRPGTALVASASFLLVIRSYTALEIRFVSLLTIVVAAWLYSIILAGVPTTGVVVMLSYLALRYGQGMEESYLILLPAVPILQRIGAVLDVLAAGFVAEVVAARGGYRKEVPVRSLV